MSSEIEATGAEGNFFVSGFQSPAKRRPHEQRQFVRARRARRIVKVHQNEETDKMEFRRISAKPPPTGAVLVWANYGPYFLRLSGIPTQVVDPSVSWAAVLHGTALTVLVEPSGPGLSRPGPVSSVGKGPVEYGVGNVPGGAYAPV